MTDNPYPKPTHEEGEALYDATWDLLDNGGTTLAPTEDPEKWIYWLTRYYGFFEVIVVSHDNVALILEGF